MKATKKITVIVLAIFLSFNLTACDPPMPPDMAAQLLEQNYTCESGSVKISFPTDMADPALQWSDSLASSCVEPLAEMSFESVEQTALPDLLVSAYAPEASVCKPDFEVPFAIEAADVAFQLADLSSLNLSPKTLTQILSGKIVSWNDPQIVAENEGTELPDTAITIRAASDANALTAMKSWLQILKQDVSGFKLNSTENLEYSPLSEGEVAIMPHSQVMANAAYSVSVIEGIDKETGEQLLAIPDSTGIASGASQLVAVKQAQTVSVKLDASLTPLAQAGVDEAAIPYQAVYAVNIYACGESSLLKHALALFLLRLDSQGVLAASNYNPLPEVVRYESLDIARKGLPTPEPAE